MKFNKQKVKAMVMEQLSEQPGLDSRRLEELLEDLLDQLEKLDLSIDYLAGAVTGGDALSIGTQQAALGRLAQQPSRRRARARMQETKSKLKDIIEEVISEQDAPEAIERAVESDAGLEELLAAMAERVHSLAQKYGFPLWRRRSVQDKP